MKRRRSPIVKVAVHKDWHKNRSGCWSLSLGDRGCRVRVIQRKPGATFERVVWLPGQGQNWASLKTTSRSEAQMRAEALLRRLLADGGPREEPPLTLGELWVRYQQEAPS